MKRSGALNAGLYNTIYDEVGNRILLDHAKVRLGIESRPLPKLKGSAKLK